MVGSSGILKVKQKLGVTFHFDKQDVVDFIKISKNLMCKTSEAVVLHRSFVLWEKNYIELFFISKLKEN